MLSMVNTLSSFLNWLTAVMEETEVTPARQIPSECAKLLLLEREELGVDGRGRVPGRLGN